MNTDDDCLGWWSTDLWDAVRKKKLLVINDPDAFQRNVFHSLLHCKLNLFKGFLIPNPNHGHHQHRIAYNLVLHRHTFWQSLVAGGRAVSLADAQKNVLYSLVAAQSLAI